MSRHCNGTPSSASRKLVFDEMLYIYIYIYGWNAARRQISHSSRDAVGFPDFLELFVASDTSTKKP